MQNWEISGIFDIRKPDPQAENRRFRRGTEGTQSPNSAYKMVYIPTNIQERRVRSAEISS